MKISPKTTFARNLPILGLICLLTTTFSCKTAVKTNAITESTIVGNLSELSSAHSDIFQLSDVGRPGSWCWFQDKRVIMDTENKKNLFSSLGS